MQYSKLKLKFFYDHELYFTLLHYNILVIFMRKSKNNIIKIRFEIVLFLRQDKAGILLQQKSFIQSLRVVLSRMCLRRRSGYSKKVAGTKKRGGDTRFVNVSDSTWQRRADTFSSDVNPPPPPPNTARGNMRCGSGNVRWSHYLSPTKTILFLPRGFVNYNSYLK